MTPFPFLHPFPQEIPHKLLQPVCHSTRDSEQRHVISRLVRTKLLQLMECCLLQMSLHLTLLHLYQLCSLTTVDIDLLLLPWMELYAHGSWRWEEGVTLVLESHLYALTAMHPMLLMLLQVDQSLLLLVIAPIMLMWLYWIHWLHLPPHGFLSFVMKEVALSPPLIVTGGKGRDVGLHDFRYIATGRSKRHRHSDKGEQVMKTSSNIDMHPGNGTKLGEQNQNGKLWYIPKAHSGSVTEISIIPNTSLFLTGSKDGDVKLWDAKRAKLVYHWPKLHERHTFLQPSTRGFGGVVQAAVTDIKVVSHGFLSCGGDGTVNWWRWNCKLKDHQHQT